ncbi:hypothetical protein pipiens_020154, partial [Culex pipiens pipiens]
MIVKLPPNFVLHQPNKTASNEDVQRGLALETEPSKTTFSDHAASSQANANMIKEKETAGLIPVQVIASSSSSAVLPHPKTPKVVPEPTITSLDLKQKKFKSTVQENFGRTVSDNKQTSLFTYAIFCGLW